MKFFSPRNKNFIAILLVTGVVCSFLAYFMEISGVPPKVTFYSNGVITVVITLIMRHRFFSSQDKKR